ncbi:MAG: hypothetical protein IH795_02615 [Bacteroidetes bacterium]|nr:hypothetical protein [Bacteroidota bacterium]
MALKLYAGRDINTGIEFMLRAESFEEAQAAAARLTSDLQVSGTLSVTNFSLPRRLAATLRSADFHSGISPFENPITPLEIYHALRVDGVDDAIATTPLTAENNFVTDFQIIAWIEFLNYEGEGRQVIASNWDSGNNKQAYTLLMDNGNLVFEVSTNGSNTTTSSFAQDPTPATGLWVRAEFIKVDSAFGGEILLYTSSSNQLTDLDKIAWSFKLSTNVFGDTLFDTGNLVLTVGAETTATANTNVPNGTIGRVAYIDGVSSTFSDNTVVVDMNPNNDADAGDTEWTSSKGEQWNIFGRASIGIPFVAGGTIGFLLDGIDGTNISIPDTSPNFDTTISLAIWLQFVTYPQDGDVGLIGKFPESDLALAAYLFELSNGIDKGFISDDDSFGDKVGNDEDYVQGEGIWTAMTWDSSTKAFTWYRSEDAISTAYETINWTPTVTSDPINEADWSISVEPIRIGSAFGINGVVNAIIGRALIIDGELDSADLYAEMYPDRDYTSGTSFLATTGRLIGETWTLNGGVTVTQV